MQKIRRSHRDLVLKQARASIRKGRYIVRVPRGRKGPIDKNWHTQRITEQQIEEYFGEEHNIGWLTGECSGNLGDVDLDCRHAVFAADKFLPSTERIHGRKSNPSSHRWYTPEPMLAPTKFTDIDGSCLLEFRSNGQQTLIPPSVHPSGERLRWEATGEPARVNGVALRTAITKVAAGALLANHYPKEGQRHEAAEALAGLLLRAKWSEAETSEFVEAVAEAADDEESAARVRDVISTAKRLAAGGPATGGPTLASIIGEEVVKRVRQWLQLGIPAEIGAAADWPDPAPLGDELPPVAGFKMDLLPATFRPLVEDVSERMQTPPDYAAAAAVVSLAGCVNRRGMIRPKLNDDSWNVVLNLWGGIVAPPGYMKSPLINAITGPLNRIQDLWRAGHAEKVAEYEESKTQAELRQAVWRSQAKKAMEKAEAIPLQPDSSITPPVEQRLMTTDSTFEKLHEILAANQNGVLVLRDELSGWLAGLDREGHEGERAFFLQAWSGDSSYTMDRIGRGSIHVPAVCVSLFGAIQPARIRWYLGDALRGGASDDGLFQRFQLMVWPDAPSGWKLVDRPANAIAISTAERAYAILANLPADEPVRLRFDPEAQQLFYKWWAQLESKVRGDSGLHPAMVGHLSKYRSLVPTLGGLFEMVDVVTKHRSLGDDPLVNLEHAQQAVNFCAYLESHANRVYSCIVSPECRAARELGRHLKRGDLASPFTTRAIYLKGWSGLDGPDSVRNALAVLQDAGWVRRVDSATPITGGRPAESWQINPKVRGLK